MAEPTNVIVDIDSYLIHEHISEQTICKSQQINGSNQ